MSSLPKAAGLLLAIALLAWLGLVFFANDAKVADNPSAAAPELESEVNPAQEEGVVREAGANSTPTSRVEASTAFRGTSEREFDAHLRTEWEVLRGPLTGQVFKVTQGQEPFDRRNETLEQHPIEFLIESPSLPPVVVGRCVTGRDGSYAFDLSAISKVVPSAAELADPQLQVRVRDERLLTSSQRVSLSSLVSTEKQTRDWRLPQTDECRLRGRVLTASGEPAEGAVVTVHSFAGKRETRTDREGRFVLDSGIRQLDAGDEAVQGLELRPLNLAALHPDHGSTEFDIDWWRVARVHDVGDVRLDPTPDQRPTILGQVLSADEHPLPHWPLHFRPNPQISWMTHQVRTTDAAGKFELIVEPGELVHLSLPGYGEVTPMEVRAPRANLVLQSFLPTASIRVVDPQGHPIQPRKSWNIYPVGSLSADSDPLLDRNLRIQKELRDGALQATFPRSGAYSIRHEWPGLRGTWRIDETFDFGDEHQEIVLTARYIPKGEV